MRGPNEQTWKLRQREPTLDKSNTTLLPNSSHPGSHIPLLLVPHTAASSRLELLLLRDAGDAAQAFAHIVISARDH